MLASLIRTYAPLLAGWLLSLPLAGPILDALNVDGKSAAAGVAAVLAAAYYALARLLERRWPALGVLLGIPAQPAYPPAKAALSKPGPVLGEPVFAPEPDATP